MLFQKILNNIKKSDFSSKKSVTNARFVCEHNIHGGQKHRNKPVYYIYI